MLCTYEKLCQLIFKITKNVLRKQEYLYVRTVFSLRVTPRRINTVLQIEQRPVPNDKVINREAQN